MYYKAVLLMVFFLTHVSGSCLYAQKGSQKYIEKSGWSIPGMTIIDDMSLIRKYEKNIENITIHASQYTPDFNKGKARPHAKLLVADKRSVKQESIETEFVVNSITQYDVDGVPFCYLVSLSPSHDGVSALESRYSAYYDEDGKGKFETREDIDLWLGGAPQGYQIRLPEWVKNTKR
jgi:hypothetical protein